MTSLTLRNIPEQLRERLKAAAQRVSVGWAMGKDPY